MSQLILSAKHENASAACRYIPSAHTYIRAGNRLLVTPIPHANVQAVIPSTL
jgi:hypothetical protein